MTQEDWVRAWFNILDGFYRERGWSDDRIRERLLEKEAEYLEKGYDPLPPELNYYSQSFHDRRRLRIS
jgi:hypothetical protein